MRNHRSVALLVPAILIHAACWNAATAEPPATKPSDSTTSPGAPKKAVLDRVAVDPQPILAKARAAMKAVQALSYVAEVGGASGGPDLTGEVSAKRAEAGGWMVWTKGASNAADGKKKEFEIGYDGATARGVRPGERTVVEKTVITMSDLAVFFSGEGARPLIAWEALADKPLESSKASSLGTAKVGEDECDVIVFPSLGTSDPDGNVTVKLFIAKSDSLPRRIERAVDSAPDGAARSLTIKDLKINQESVAGRYSVDVPDGFRIKAAGASDKPKPKPSANSQSDRGPLAIGDTAPDFSLLDPSGATLTWKDFEGKVVLIDFWGTWCPPCRAAMPSMQKLHEKYKGKPVEIVGFNVEQSKKANPAKFMADNKYTYRLLLNAEQVAPQYKVPGFPTFYVVGKDRKIKFAAVGFDPKHNDEISKVIDAELGR